MRTPDPKNIKRIVIVKLYGIGNALLSIPFLQEVRHIFPNAKITLLIEKRSWVIFKNLSFLYNDVFFLPVKNIRGKIRLFYELLKRRPQIIFASYLMNNRTLEKMFRLIGAGSIFGYPIDGKKYLYTHPLMYNKRRHEVMLNLDLLSSFRSYKNEEVKIEFPLPKKKFENTRNIFNEFENSKPVKIGLHLGSNWDMPEKRYPVSKFAALSDRLIEQFDADILLFGGKEEIDLGAQITTLMKQPPINLIGKYDLMDVAGLIKNCDLFISNDSGLMHLAASVGCPLIALFGPTSIYKNGPWGEAQKIRIIRSQFTCMPCHIPGSMISCDDNQCMQNIEVDDIVKTADKMLSEKVERD